MLFFSLPPSCFPFLILLILSDLLPEYKELERMEPQERTLDCLHLENGLRVYFIDRSSPPVAGRCQVRLLILAPVEATEDHFSNYPDPSGALSRFISLAGPGPVEFQTIKIRNFVAPKDVEKTLKDMMDDFMRAGLQYLKNSGFAAKFVRKKYEELLAAAAVSTAHEEALRNMEGE
jgi:hypothetical protein